MVNHFWKKLLKSKFFVDLAFNNKVESAASDLEQLSQSDKAKKKILQRKVECPFNVDNDADDWNLSRKSTLNPINKLSICRTIGPTSKEFVPQSPSLQIDISIYAVGDAFSCLFSRWYPKSDRFLHKSKLFQETPVPLLFEWISSVERITNFCKL